LSHAFFIVLQKKIKEKKSNIRKIKENKIKIVSVQMSHNTALFYTIPKVKMTNNAKEAIVLEITLEPYSSVIINMCKL